MKLNYLIFLIAFIFQNVIGAGSDSSKHIYTGLQTHYGFIIPHSKSIRDISYTNPVGIELSCNKLHTSFNRWKVFNAYWISGIEARYFNYQNPEILGGVFDVSVFAEPVILYGRNHLLTIRGGGGVSYHTKVYDPVDNPMNMFFGSRMSFPLFIDVRFKYRAGERTFVTFSGCYNHISNGGIKQPNKGMNFPTLAIGLEYFRKQIPHLQNNFKTDIKASKPNPNFIIQALTSIKVLGGVNDIPEKPALIYGFHGRFSKPLSAFYALNVGAEGISDGYIKETISREQREIDHKRFALTAGQDFMLGKVVFTQYLGYYLYSPYKAPNSVYQKYELAYKFYDKFMLGVYLKAHLQVAELMGINMSLILF